MQDKQVIEIPSSPDSSPKPEARRVQPRRRRARNTRRAQPIPAEDIIELTDSEDASSSRAKHGSPLPSKQVEEVAPMAGPSRVVLPEKAPALFYPESDEEHAAGPSKNVEEEPPQPVFVAGPVVEESFVPKPASAPGSLLVEAEAAQIDPFDGYVAQVLEIIPNVLPEHVRVLIEHHFPTHKEKVVETVLHLLFEDPTYPKADPKGKGKRKIEDVDGAKEEVKNAKPKVDYGSKDRQIVGGRGYVAQALQQLYIDFPRIPVLHVRQQFNAHNTLYAPTYLYLHEEAKKPNLPYKLKASKASKGKGVALDDPELEKEIEWVKLKMQADGSVVEHESEDTEDGIECGCCFSSYPFDKMIQCPEAHLFCTECMTTYAETLLGSHDANIVCMDQSGCKLPFPESELRRFLSSKLLALYDRVKQRKEIEAAGLENLEECPFCDYKCVIENEQEKLFRCENQECMAVTCRECKKPDHLPKNCKEVDDDKKLDVRHAIEEAMTRALMRNCPSCNKAFVKEMGCNKMICPQCRTMSCYVCRRVITGYDHFNNPPPYTGQANPNKCQLWDSVEQRHSDEVTAAAKKAIEEFKRAHPELAEEDLHVDLPPPPAAGPSNVPAAGAPAPAVQALAQRAGLQALGAAALDHQRRLVIQRQMGLVPNVHVNIQNAQLPPYQPLPVPRVAHLPVIVPMAAPAAPRAPAPPPYQPLPVPRAARLPAVVPAPAPAVVQAPAHVHLPPYQPLPVPRAARRAALLAAAPAAVQAPARVRPPRRAARAVRARAP